VIHKNAFIFLIAPWNIGWF